MTIGPGSSSGRNGRDSDNWDDTTPSCQELYDEAPDWSPDDETGTGILRRLSEFID